MSLAKLVNPRSLVRPCSAHGGCEFGFTYPDWLDNHMSEMQTPFIILHGKADKVTDPATSQKLHEEAVAKDKTLKPLGEDHERI